MIEEVKVFVVNCHVNQALVCDMEGFEDVDEFDGNLKAVIRDFIRSLFSESVQIATVFDDLSNIFKADHLQSEKSLDLTAFVSFSQAHGIKFSLN